MPLFNIGETIKCNLWIKDLDGNLVDPSSIPEITITDPDGTEVATDEDETYESVGHYYYPLQTTTDFIMGEYQIKHYVVDGLAITIEWDAFVLGR
jgi:uncharacterized protein YfaS (alpha-2-macroglobulin family)